MFSPFSSGTRKARPRIEALMEAVVKQVRTSRLIACDANMCPEDFEKSQWLQSRHMCIKAPGGEVSTCRSKSPKGEVIERPYDFVMASRSLQGDIRNMECLEAFAKPHRAVSFVVGRVKEIQEWREQHCMKRHQASVVESCQKSRIRQRRRRRREGRPRKADEK